MNAFLSTYALANRWGLLERPLFRRLFAKAYFAYKKYLEDPFTTLAERHPSIFRGGHILDVGANIGYTATLFAQYVSPGFKVFAFEPEGRNFAMLQDRIRREGLSETVIPIHAAAGDQTTQAELWLNPDHHADHRMVTDHFKGVPKGTVATETVRVIRLDDYCLDHLPKEPIRFIKIDVQGFEERVCKGMVGILDKNPEAIVALEYYPQGIEELGLNPPDVLNLFRDRGYVAYCLTRKRGLERLSYPQIAETTAKTPYVDLLFSKSDTILDGNTE